MRIQYRWLIFGMVCLIVTCGTVSAQTDLLLAWVTETGIHVWHDHEQPIQHIPMPSDVLIGEVHLARDGMALYYSTRFWEALGARDTQDLIRLDLITLQPQTILSANSGIGFAFSPDNQWVAYSAPGVYEQTEGAIYVLNLHTGDAPILLMRFAAVATGSHEAFAPRLQWSADSRSLLTSLPSPDLIYHEAANSPTTLWRLAFDADPYVLGQVRASYFGLPIWSDDGTQMIYFQRQNATEIALVWSDGVGNQAHIIAQGTVGSLRFLQWVPHDTALMYQHLGETYRYHSEIGSQALALNDEAYAMRWVDDRRYVALVSQSDRTWQLQDGQIGAASRIISRIEGELRAWDLVVRQ